MKAVFFDWFNTLVHYAPRPEEVMRETCKELGIKLTSREILRGILASDRFFYEEHSRLKFDLRSRDEQVKLFVKYHMITLETCGVKVPWETGTEILKRTEAASKGSKVVLFEDVEPALTALRQRGLTVGMISNATRNIDDLLAGLGLDRMLDVVVVSCEAGADKPQPEIFNLALKRAGAAAAEAMHVGDQLAIDVAGARGAGMTAVLLDRYDLQPGVDGCRRIRTLADVAEMV